MDIREIQLTESQNATLVIADGTDFDPQTMAMLQAFYSRSTMSIVDRVGDLDGEAVRESLRRYYMGYGHRSIGQCGNFTLFLEDVSIFAAKAIQHHPLYNGQETSTRYYDFSSRPIIDPLRLCPQDVPNVTDLGQHLEGMRELYTLVTAYASAAYEQRARESGEEMTPAMLRACKAKAFDVSRCLLTAGYTTKLSWTTNFDQVQEQLAWLLRSPVVELNTLGLTIGEALHERYPNAVVAPDEMYSSRNAPPFFDPTENIARSLGMYDLTAISGEDIVTVVSRFDRMLDITLDNKAYTHMTARAKYEPVPKSFSAYGTYTFAFNIDYGSFRDLHRHRNGIVYFPHYPSDRKVMHPWYVDELASLDVLTKPGIGGKNVGECISAIYSHVLPQISEAVASLYELGSDAYHAAMMYYIPMGTMVTAVMRYDLPQAVYVAELRSGRTVHETARIAAHGMAERIRESLPRSIPIYTDTFSGISERRGQQTIMTADGEALK